MRAAATTASRAQSPKDIISPRRPKSNYKGIKNRFIFLPQYFTLLFLRKTFLIFWRALQIVFYA
jgi:hypothetical protein